jgi:hypothetical protein
MSLQGGFLQDEENDAASGLFFRGDNLSVLAPQGSLGPVNRCQGVNSLNGPQGNLGGMNFFLPPQGNVPSHISVASSATSVVATSGYFGTTWHSSANIDACQVICPKTDCGAHGSRDYSCNQEAATRALPNIFASAKHFHAKNSEGEDSNKYANLQSKYVGYLGKIKTLKQHMAKWDMSGPFVIPDLLNPHTLSAKD